MERTKNLQGIFIKHEVVVKVPSVLTADILSANDLERFKVQERRVMPTFELSDGTKFKPVPMSLNKTFCGIDNGVTGGITILASDGSVVTHAATPVKKCMNYTKKKAFINRVNSFAFRELISQAGENTFVMIERPMVNPGRFMATISAIRCLEATELILEELKIPYQFIDSKEWQKALLPSGLKGSDELKIASKSVASRLYPRLKIVNSDCLLIALYCKNKMS